MAKRTFVSKERAKEVLKYENMPNEEKYAYNRYVENRRIEMGVLETAEDKGDRKRQIKVAITCLGKGFPFDLIVEVSGLFLSEVQLLSEGKDMDMEDNAS